MKSQASIELIYAVAILIVIFSIIIGLNYAKSSETNELNEYLNAKYICNNLMVSIDYALSGGNNYTQYVEFPELVGNEEYNISIVSGKIIVNFGNIVSCSTGANITNGTSENFTIGKKIMIKNRNGTIFLSEVV